MEKAYEMGISKRVVDAAKKRLHVESVRSGSQWFWQFSDQLPM